MFCSMRLEIPFIAPRELRAVGAPFGRPLLPSVRWRTGLSGAHWIVNSTHMGRCKESSDWLVSASRGTGLFGAPVDRWSGVDVATSRCAAGTPDCLVPRVECPVNYSRHSQKNLRAASLAGPCTGLSDAHQTVRWVAPDRPVLRSPAAFPCFSLCLLLFLLDLI